MVNTVNRRGAKTQRGAKKFYKIFAVLCIFAVKEFIR